MAITEDKVFIKMLTQYYIQGPNTCSVINKGHN